MILDFLLTLLAIDAFSVLFCTPKEQRFFCALTGALGWISYQLLLRMGSNFVFASLLASFHITFLSRLFAALRQTPVTVYLMPGILPLVPGAGIYYTSYYLIMQEMQVCAAKGVETFQIAGAIVLGITFAFSLPQDFFQRKKNGHTH